MGLQTAWARRPLRQREEPAPAPGSVDLGRAALRGVMLGRSRCGVDLGRAAVRAVRRGEHRSAHPLDSLLSHGDLLLIVRAASSVVRLSHDKSGIDRQSINANFRWLPYGSPCCKFRQCERARRESFPSAPLRAGARPPRPPHHPGSRRHRSDQNSVPNLVCDERVDTERPDAGLVPPVSDYALRRGPLRGDGGRAAGCIGNVTSAWRRPSTHVFVVRPRPPGYHGR